MPYKKPSVEKKLAPNFGNLIMCLDQKVVPKLPLRSSSKAVASRKKKIALE